MICVNKTCLKIIVILLVLYQAESYALEQYAGHDFVDTKDADKIRNIPVSKLSYRSPTNVKNVNKSKDIFSKAKNYETINLRNEDNFDNVREFVPTSREEIKQLRKLSFHGRKAPFSVIFKSENLTDNSRSVPPFQIDYKQQNYGKLSNLEIKKQNVKKASNFNQHVNGDSPFLPLLRPSPINVLPIKSPSMFGTMRNYVNFLKMRQTKYFGDVLDEKPIYGGEIDYLVQREKEIVNEENKNQSAENHFGKNDRVGTNESYDENSGEESAKQEKFVPYKLYAQVRHTEAKNHVTNLVANEPRIIEKVSLEKKNLYYKEEGFKEQNFDHGVEEEFSDDKEFKKPQKRVKRSDNDNNFSYLPQALTLIKKSELQNYNGKKLNKHMEELFKQSSIFLKGDYDDIEDAFSMTNKKYPYYNLPKDVLPEMSAFRYAESNKNYPGIKESLYKFKDRQNKCKDNDQEVDDPSPDGTNGNSSTSELNPSSQRLNKLGRKINCLRQKYFGNDPFENPLFKENDYGAASSPIKLEKIKNTLPNKEKTLLIVYDDVINNIRMQKSKNKPDDLKPFASSPQETLSDGIGGVPQNVKIVNYASVAGIGNLRIFDINKYYPSYKAPATVGYKADYEMEFIEAPINIDYKNQQSGVREPIDNYGRFPSTQTNKDTSFRFKLL